MSTYSFSENMLGVLKKLKLLLKKEKVPYMLIGGIAVALWGEPRATQDIDIDIVVLMGKNRVFGFLKEAKKYGFSYQKEEVNNLLKANLLRLVWQKDFFLMVDLIISDTKYQEIALKRRKREKIIGEYFWFVSPEDLVLHKLIAGRAIDIKDARSIFGREKERLDVTYLNKWAKEWEVEKKLFSLKRNLRVLAKFVAKYDSR